MEKKSPHCNPEIWAGIECSINRVGNVYRDQLEYAGHYHRPHDIADFASLGIKTLRYPLLWEKHQPEKATTIDWTWSTKQLDSIRAKNITPIVGLLHHGSGPVFTDLLDDQFPYLLADYAKEVARQFPWVEYYTPVNEPLTTARFSGLYGLWFPHDRNDRSFCKMLLNQVKAIVLVMREIRKINPQAKLVQTEDLSKTHSTSLLTYQANFENHRRWLTYDLLCGLVDSHHALWNYFISQDIPAAELNFFVANPCVPEIMGLNYYITSERFLDENVDAYPLRNHGGNSMHSYADVEAVRSGHIAGLESLLTEAFNRYQLPIAVTECHLSCTRDEQLRWFMECWGIVCRLRDNGLNIRAITAWALLGAYDWDSLLTEHTGTYECGIFDNTDQSRKQTVLGNMLYCLNKDGVFAHHLLSRPGWWRADEINNQYPKETAIIVGNNHLADCILHHCKTRRMLCCVLTSKQISQEPLDLTTTNGKETPWSIIDTTAFDKDYEHRDPRITHIDQRLLKVARMADELSIPLLSFRPRNDYYFEIITHCYPDSLLIQLEGDSNNSTQLSTNVSRSLDMFIDGRNGIYRMGTAVGPKIKSDLQFQCVPVHEEILIAE